ncbi:enoyl-CoA hydratase/isomerase family protein [Rhodococcus sp. 114MFTsu3.1]|uniref:enoyl-CoA hydratase/isomerase family protein n=1 Tax=Rhodococcus sp. 114MFTsu3.1 TaxID=1172184 RepID=UPI00035E9A0B|nr:enoyl-CoA hydratase/isomerase family protein [Rhodococcus sp. 114MFTsu3.1]
MNYEDYQHLRFERRDNGVLLVIIDRPERANAANERLHDEFAEVWRTIGRDAEARIAVITGRGAAFSAGGDLKEHDDPADGLRSDRVLRSGQVAKDIVYNMLDLDKPIISAINGVAVGAGLAIALTADISVIGEDVRITDGHSRLGISSGDHAVMMWPWLCGMAKSKFYLLTADFLTGAEAERIGLVSIAVPVDQVLERAMSIADQLGRGPQRALRSTKRSLNHVLRTAAPAFELSVALETIDLYQEDAREGIAAFQEKRQPIFPSARESN